MENLKSECFACLLSECLRLRTCVFLFSMCLLLLSITLIDSHDGFVAVYIFILFQRFTVKEPTNCGENNVNINMHVSPKDYICESKESRIFAFRKKVIANQKETRCLPLMRPGLEPGCEPILHYNLPSTYLTPLF